MTDRTNEQWLEQLNGPPEAQGPAIEALRTRLQRGIFYYLSRERSDLYNLSTQELTRMAEDLAQDATLRVMGNLESFRGDSRFTTWATKIAVRVAISDLRRARYKDFSLEDMTADGEMLPIPSNTVSPGLPPNPESATERADVMAKISAALEQSLTERQHKALTAVALNGVPMDVVAEQLGTNRNALYKLIHDARRKLKTNLEAQGITMDYVMELFQD